MYNESNIGSYIVLKINVHAFFASSSLMFFVITWKNNRCQIIRSDIMFCNTYIQTPDLQLIL